MDMLVVVAMTIGSLWDNSFHSERQDVEVGSILAAFPVRMTTLSVVYKAWANGSHALDHFRQN